MDRGHFLKNRRRESGQSLVQVLIAAAIGGIVMMAMVSHQANQAVENKALSEKLASLELQRSITAALSSTVSCTSLLAPSNVIGGASALTINAVGASEAHPRIINLRQVAGASIGGLASPMSSSLSIKNSGGIELRVTSPTTGSLAVNFDQTKNVRAVHDLIFDKISLVSSGPLGSTKINGCGSAALTGPRLCKLATLNRLTTTCCEDSEASSCVATAGHTVTVGSPNSPGRDVTSDTNWVCLCTPK